MTNEKRNESKLNTEPPALPDDVATLYSWANLHGAKYRDFSATRQEARSQARVRAQAEPAAVEPPAAVEAPVVAKAEVHVESTPEIPAELKVEAKSQPLAETRPPVKAEPHVETRPAAKAEPVSATRGAWEELIAPPPAAAVHEAPSAALPPAEKRAAEPIPQTPFQAPYQASYQAPPPAFTQPEPPVTSAAPFAPSSHPYAYDQQARDPRPQFFSAAYQPVMEPQPAERISSRWYTLNSVLGQQADGLQRRLAADRDFRIPVLAVFSLAGGVGKTGIVATLGRTLAARGESVLLVDTSSYGLLPLYYGAQDVRPGALRTFSGGATDAAVQLLSLDTERYPENDRHALVEEIARNSQRANRIVIDVATASSSVVRPILRLSPKVLVPLVPDVSSVASLQGVEAFFNRMGDLDGRFVEPMYVLNGFDSAIPLHVEVREILRQKLGARLLPFVLHRSPAVTEALAEGMTVVDYSPCTPVAEDYASLSSWIREVAPPAGRALRGKRWSEQQLG